MHIRPRLASRYRLMLWINDSWGLSRLSENKSGYLARRQGGMAASHEPACLERPRIVAHWNLLRTLGLCSKLEVITLTVLWEGADEAEEPLIYFQIVCAMKTPTHISRSQSIYHSASSICRIPNMVVIDAASITVLAIMQLSMRVGILYPCLIWTIIYLSPDWKFLQAFFGTSYYTSIRLRRLISSSRCQMAIQASKLTVVWDPQYYHGPAM